MNALIPLHEEILACRRCEAEGFILPAAPVVSGPVMSRIMLIGQAPGRVELVERRPFQGKAGRVLFTWLRSVGIHEDEFRESVYMTAITKCFPGPAAGGNGDRRPSAREIALCRPFLDRQLEIVRPAVILLVGGLAIERFLPKAPLADLVGRRIEQDGRMYIPLPHPSGASRWLNHPEHKELLARAMEQVRDAWTGLGESRGEDVRQRTVVAAGA
ncbi:MAG TPA: uracil-DNA glycosylase [Chloroflexota bacterium]|nr:uracil-DNA glycosylase [Chloroflexota bacterium]